ncbi:hypothetical protein DVS77_28780 [Mycolicibacterium moriokaense]|nr:hypothetical protein DVS77_28780 [Mycolicibacterium moriokaense]
MKIKSIAAVGAMGVGLGFASFVAGTGTASATCNTPTTPPAERVSCLVNADLATFKDSISPANNINTFLHGTTDSDGNNDGLGILDQPQTFVNSLKDFASGPVAP